MWKEEIPANSWSLYIPHFLLSLCCRCTSNNVCLPPDMPKSCLLSISWSCSVSSVHASPPSALPLLLDVFQCQDGNSQWWGEEWNSRYSWHVMLQHLGGTQPLIETLLKGLLWPCCYLSLPGVPSLIYFSLLPSLGTSQLLSLVRLCWSPVNTNGLLQQDCCMYWLVGS